MMNQRIIKNYEKVMQIIIQYYKKVSEQFVQYYSNNKGKKTFTYTAIGVPIIFLITLSILLFNSYLNKTLIAYEVLMDGERLAIVRTEDIFMEIVEEVKKEIESEYNQEAVITEEIIFVETKADDGALTSRENIIRNIKMQLDIKVKGVAIQVNGESVVVVRDLSTARQILGAVKESYLQKEEDEYLDVGFGQKVELVEIATEAGFLRSKEEALQVILKGTDEERIHEVAAGESTWTIARKYDLTVDDIARANPNLKPEKLQIGDKISLVVPRPYITVTTKEYAELVEAIPFETEYVETNSLYKGDRKITVQGIEGQREIKAYIIKENGVEVDREIIAENIIKEPKTRVIAQGTKARPATVATGLFSNPTRGRLTSGFGMRWGRRHDGIDIAAPTGTPVSAADAGKVSFAGRNGAYGNLVIIDHENGYQTYYAHNNTILVKKGDRVHKGQQIATVGSTGNSTGPHLHFEVRKNGSPVNPLQFVKY